MWNIPTPECYHHNIFWLALYSSAEGPRVIAPHTHIHQTKKYEPWFVTPQNRFSLLSVQLRWCKQQLSHKLDWFSYSWLMSSYSEYPRWRASVRNVPMEMDIVVNVHYTYLMVAIGCARFLINSRFRVMHYHLVRVFGCLERTVFLQYILFFHLRRMNVTID